MAYRIERLARAEEVPMANDVSTITKPGTKPTAKRAGYSSAKKPVMVPGRRDFFSYRDLGVKDASDGTMRAQITSAITGMTQPTGWHYHVCEHQFVYALKGWVELEFENGEMCRLEPGDSIYIPGGLKHNELRTSDDLEILELSLPGEIGTVPCDPPAKHA
jgi:mannose-6-phosphate isomerase-like protein (cupin superfamily)